MSEIPEDMRAWAAEHNEDALFADGYEDAIIGMAVRCGQPALIVYDAAKCIEILIERDSMEPEEAIEFFEFNTLNAWVGVNTPLFMWRRENKG